MIAPVCYENPGDEHAVRSATVVDVGLIEPLTEAVDGFNERLRALEAATSDEQRAVLASQLWEHGSKVLLPAVTTQRCASVRRLRANYTLAAIGEMLGVNDSRVAQIIRGPE